MNREIKRHLDRQRRREAGRAPDREYEASPEPGRERSRTGVRTFLHEVRVELRRVAWPSRKEVASYSLVVLVAVSLIGTFIFALDQLFGQFTLWVFG